MANAVRAGRPSDNEASDVTVLNPKNRNLKIPTQAEYAAFDGRHCRNLYRSLAEDRRCPGCARSKFEILRWTLLYPKLPTRYEGWAGGYHRHHDHGVGLIRFGRGGRFPDTVVCEQCNSADGTAKRKLKLPGAFSFAPSEIRAFVTATPHGFHVIDFAVAQAIFDALQIPSRPSFGST